MTQPFPSDEPDLGNEDSTTPAPAPAPARTRFAEPAGLPAAPPPGVEVAPAEIHQAEIHQAEIHQAEIHPAETEAAEPCDEGLLPAAEADLPEAPEVPEVIAATDPELEPAPDLTTSSEPVGEHADEDVLAVPAGRGRGLVTVLAVVVAALVLLTGFLGWKAKSTAGPAPVEASGPAALDAARSAARLVFSYDYRHLDKDFKAGRATTTGQFQGEYDKTTARLVTDVAPRYKAVVLAAVSEASVVSATQNQVVTLVFLNQQSSSSLMSNPKITQSRLEMTMVRRGGKWLVGKIQAL
ncbi:MAG: hypothetical protein JWM02_616 [Frankiales bacterium]|nr:hypothetical protein [Frankiales bacterium]